jgi:hypothetical protein
MTKTAVYLELGTRRVFACAVDWPGWCRIGRTEEEALETLAAYLPRYAPVAELARAPAPSDAFDVVERLGGKAAYTDFGVPGVIAAGDARPTGAEEAARQGALLEAVWTRFDQVVRASPAELRKGPRGGGRDRDKMVDHVLGAEAGYGRKYGVRFKQPALDDRAAIEAARAAQLEVLAGPSDGTPPVPRGWPIRYAIRRIAWHALDHAWEMEDRSTTR